MSRVLRKNQVISWLTLLLLIPVSIIPGSSLWSRTLDCPHLSLSVNYFFGDSITHVEFGWAERGQFLMATGVRQGCLASGFLFVMACDQIFRWLQETIIPNNLDRTRQICWYYDWPRWDTFIIGRHTGQSSNAWWKLMFPPKVSDCVTSKFTRFLCWFVIGSVYLAR